MTTDQITNADTRPSSADSQRAAARADNEVTEIIAKARHDAFRIVTQARRDADAIVAEARREASELIRAGGPDGAVSVENADLLAVNAALRAEYNELAGMIEDSQQLIEKLDTRLLDLATMPDSMPSLDGSVDEVAHDVGRQVAPFVFDYAPAVAPAPKQSRTKNTEQADSFYTRKSAKLPRIGREGGQDALDVVKTMRDRLRDEAAN